MRKTDREYCTRTHDSLIITPANGFFHWFSRNVGGNNAIDYLTKVEGIQRNLRCGINQLRGKIRIRLAWTLYQRFVC